MEVFISLIVVMISWMYIAMKTHKFYTLNICSLLYKRNWFYLNKSVSTYSVPGPVWALGTQE